ncbi:MAG: hypothetical protein JEZ12_27260 [Desulfobacterium sp.]|nr:hypothetical protein [Desulfobacterium sp.]
MGDPKKNPIEQRIDYLSGLWNEFAQDPAPRLLRWRVDDDGVRMVELLIEMQSEDAGDLPDLFIRFDTPFTDPRSYGFDLMKSLEDQYEESRKDIADTGVPADWQCPEPKPEQGGAQAFARACISFMEYHKDNMLALVLFLAPLEIPSKNEWNHFLRTLVKCGLPRTIRLTVIDHIERPALNELCKAEPELTRTITPELDMPDALEEIADGGEGVGPGNDFRKLFVKLSNLAAKGDVKQTETLAAKALGIAKKQHWFDLQVAVYMVMGAMQLGKGAPEQALTVYRKAVKTASEADLAAHPLGKKLVVQTRFAEAAVLIGKADFNDAASLYESTVPFTQASGDPLLELEAWRMASYCHGMTDTPGDAIRCGNLALKAGALLEEELRTNSTLPYAGRHLISLIAKYKPDEINEQQVREQMVALVGEDWELYLPPGDDTS